MPTLNCGAERHSSETDDAFSHRLVDHRAILVRSLADGRLSQAEAVIRSLAGNAAASGYYEIGRIATEAQERLSEAGPIQAALPYMCQLAVEIDRALAADRGTSPVRRLSRS